MLTARNQSATLRRTDVTAIKSCVLDIHPLQEFSDTYIYLLSSTDFFKPMQQVFRTNSLPCCAFEIVLDALAWL